MNRSYRIAAVTTAIAASVLLVATPALAAPPTNLDRLNFHSPTTDSAGDTVFFAGYATGKGVELFKTDGTDAGTKLVKDIFQGSGSAFWGQTPERNAAQFVPFGAQTLFVANDGTGDALFATDGTSAGTIRLTPGGATPYDGEVLDGEYYFSANDPILGQEVWKTDGTVEGTTVAFDIRTSEPASGVRGSVPHDFARVGNKIYFVASVKAQAENVYVTDGETASIAATVGTANGTLEDGGQLAAFGNGVAYVLRGSGAPGVDIWTTDGTPGGTAKLATATNISYGSPLVDFDGALYYYANDSTAGGTTLRKLTASGTVTAVSPLPISGFAVQGDALWYTTYDKSTKTGTLWRAANSTDAPVKVKDIYVSSRVLESFDSSFSDGLLYFWANGALFTSDGTTDGTVEVKNFGLPKNQVSSSEIAVTNGLAVVVVQDTNNVGSVWLSDGSTAGTFQRLPASTFTAAATPKVKGTAVVGSTLTGFVGTWTPTGAKYSYQWSAGGVAIEGATAKTFVVTAAQGGKTLTLSVTGSKPGFKSVKKTSVATAKVPKVFTAAPEPTITGVLAAGETLTAVTGTWTPTATFTYQWNADGKAIKGRSTSATYVATATSALKVITVTVTAKRAGYTTASLTSAPASATLPG